MSFYEAKEVVTQALVTRLKAAYAEKGLETKPIVEQHNSLITAFSDLYSKAILLTGTIKRDAPLFSNVPSPAFQWNIDKQLEEIFEVLGWKTTQQQVSILAKELKRRSLDNLVSADKLLQLYHLSFFKKEVSKASEWIVLARQHLLTMHENIQQLQTVTQEEKEFSELLKFDWYYDYSDDNSVWRFGQAKHNDVIAKVKAVLVDKPHLRKVVETVAASHGFSPSFFLGKE